MKKPYLNFNRANELLSYDKESGLVSKHGYVVGASNGTGYIQIWVDGHKYYAHRLAFLLVTGDWPCGEIDHINGDRSDNKWSNLRSASRSENCRNIGLTAKNTSGFKGVSWDGHKQKWRVQIYLNLKRHSLGYHETAREAAEVYKDAESKLFGEFCRRSQA